MASCDIAVSFEPKLCTTITLSYSDHNKTITLATVGCLSSAVGTAGYAKVNSDLKLS